MSKDTKAIIYALVAVLSWSTVATAFKLTLQHLTHFEMVLVASITATVVFAIAATVQGKWHRLKALYFRDWLGYVLLGLLNPVAYYIMLFWAYDLLPAHIAQPINYTWPILLLLLLSVISSQRIPMLKYVGMLISLCGVAAISLGNASERAELSVTGIIVCFISALIWAIYWVVNRRNKEKEDNTISLLLTFFFGSVYLAVAALYQGTSITRTEGILGATYIGVFEMGIPFICFATALKLTKNPTLINQLTYLAPFLSLFIIAMILHETITLTTIVGLVLIVLGIVLNEFVFKSSPEN